jgi:hypothetical protein
MDFNDLLRRAGKIVSDNSPSILTAIGVVGTVTTAYLTGQASFRAAEIIAEQDLGARLNQEGGIKTREKFELVWQLYIPAAGSAAMTVACIVAANRIGNRRAAALAAVYALSERAFDEYKVKVVEKLGEKREQAVRDEVAQDRVRNTEAASREVVVVSGQVLCLDLYTQRYFTSSVEELKSAQNEINHQVNNDYYASLTDFYNQIGLASTSFSDEVGWNSDKLLDLKFSTAIAGDGRPCITFDFVVAPIRNHYRLQ